MCLICIKYMIIIIIISLGQILLSYIAKTSRTHARMHAMHARTRTHTHAVVAVRLSLIDGSVAPNRDVPLLARCAGDHGRCCFIQINAREGDPVSPTFCVFFAYKKIARPN